MRLSTCHLVRNSFCQKFTAPQPWLYLPLSESIRCYTTSSTHRNIILVYKLNYIGTLFAQFLFLFLHSLWFFKISYMTGKDYHNFIFVLLREEKLPPAVKLNCEHALKIFICRHFDTQEAVTALATESSSMKRQEFLPTAQTWISSRMTSSK